MRKRGALLADYGYTSDPGCLELTDSTIVFYHYTWVERAERLLEPGSGLMGSPPSRLRASRSRGLFPRRGAAGAAPALDDRKPRTSETWA